MTLWDSCSPVRLQVVEVQALDAGCTWRLGPKGVCKELGLNEACRVRGYVHGMWCPGLMDAGLRLKQSASPKWSKSSIIIYFSIT